MSSVEAPGLTKKAKEGEGEAVQIRHPEVEMVCRTIPLIFFQFEKIH